MTTLYTLLCQIEAVFGVRICVHDISGITFTSHMLELPRNWKNHGCAYCQSAKAFVGEKRCMLQKDAALRKLRRNGVQPFFGICNMGVCEYIYPVLQERKLLAVIFASGVTREDADAACEKLLAQAQRAHIPPEEVLPSFEQFALHAGTSREALLFFAQLAEDFILRHTVAGSSRVSAPDGSYPVEPVPPRKSGIAAAIIAYLDENYAADLSLKKLASLFFISEGHLCRLIRQELGMSVMSYIKRLRMGAAARQLVRTDLSVRDIGRLVGISDTNYFCRCFRSVMGVTPTEYRHLHTESHPWDAGDAPLPRG